MRHRHTLLVLTSLLLILLAASLPQPSRTLAAQVSEEPPHSIFTNDTCSAPCWFGLTPGISTQADVEAFVTNDQRIFRWLTTKDNATGNILYHFNFKYYELGFSWSRFFVRNGILQKMEIGIDEFVTLNDVLDRMGLPDEVMIQGTQFGYDMDFFYFDNLVHIRLENDYANLWRDCENSSLSEAFWVRYTIYYSTEAEIRSDLDDYIPQYYGELVPDDLRKQLFESNPHIYCQTAMRMIFQAINPSEEYSEPLFIEDDSCRKGYCWFYLQPDQSYLNSAYVERTLVRHFPILYGYASRESAITEFDEAGLIFNGWYEVYFRYYERHDVEQAPSLILIENGQVEYVQIQMNRVITLTDALGRLGVPEQVYLQQDNGRLVLSLGYEEHNWLRVDFLTTEDECMQAALGDAFKVDTASFFGVDDSITLETDAHLIPVEIWSRWLQEKTGILCASAIGEMMGIDQ